MNGTREKKVNSISVCCMSPEARDLLDLVNDVWHKEYDHCGIKELEEYNPYSAFYWLIRWSGLIESSKKAKLLIKKGK